MFHIQLRFFNSVFSKFFSFRSFQKNTHISYSFILWLHSGKRFTSYWNMGHKKWSNKIRSNLKGRKKKNVYCESQMPTWHLLNNRMRISSNLGLIHTRHFCTQYYDKKDNFEPQVSFDQGKLLAQGMSHSSLSLPWLDIETYGSKIFLLQYLFIFLSQYCVQKF